MKKGKIPLIPVALCIWLALAGSAAAQSLTINYVAGNGTSVGPVIGINCSNPAVAGDICSMAVGLGAADTITVTAATGTDTVTLSSTVGAICTSGTGTGTCAYTPMAGQNTQIFVTIAPPPVNPSLTIANGGAGTTGWSVGDNAAAPGLLPIPCPSPAGCANANTTGAANVTVTMNCRTATDIASLTSDTLDAVCNPSGIGTTSCVYTASNKATTLTATCGAPSLTVTNGGGGTSGWATAGQGAWCTSAVAPCTNADTRGVIGALLTLTCNTAADTATLTGNTGDVVCGIPAVGSTSCTYTASGVTATTLTATCAAAAPPAFPSLTVVSGGAGTSGWTISAPGVTGVNGCTNLNALCTNDTTGVAGLVVTLTCNTGTNTAAMTSNTGDAICAGASCTYTATGVTATTLTATCAAAAPAPAAGGGGGGGGGGLENQPPYYQGGGGWLRSPSNGGSGNGNTPFVWLKLTDLDGDTITYYVYVCPNGVFEGCQPIKVVVGNDDTIPTRLGYGMGALGAGLLLIGFGFTRGGRRTWLVLLAAISLTGSAALIACGASSGSSNGVTVASCSAAGADARCAENLGLAAGAYQWKVTAEDGRGGQIESEARSFTVK